MSAEEWELAQKAAEYAKSILALSQMGEVDWPIMLEDVETLRNLIIEKLDKDAADEFNGL